MKSFIDFALCKNRATIFIFISMFLMGIYSYVNLPKESTPDIQIPFVFVSTDLRGISAEDSERLLVKPIEEELRSLEGVREMTSVSQEGGGRITLEFEASYDINKAIYNVKDKIDRIESKLPSGASRPTVKELNLSAMPILYIGLLGDIPDIPMLNLSKSLKEAIEAIPGILEVRIAGKRKERIEVIMDPKKIEFYNINIEEVSMALSRNNSLIPTGNIISENSQFSIILPSTFGTISDIMNTPIIAKKHSIIRLKDVATIKHTLEDKRSINRMNGQPCLVLEISKRAGYNIIEMVSKVKSVISKSKEFIPSNISILYSRDESNKILDMISDLENNVLFAVALVVIMIASFIGIRSSILVSIAIPGSFLIGLCIISYLGFTLNIVVLFSLILSVGMLVDSAIVISEYADRKMITGIPAKIAFRDASLYMLWPIISSTLTTIVVFLPLLFWPGLVGQFMQYLPYTLIATLFGSTVMALIFIPVIGSMIGKPSTLNPAKIESIKAVDQGDIKKLGSVLSIYHTMLDKVLKRPIIYSLTIISILFTSIFMFSLFGTGIEFFPKIDPEFATIIIKSPDGNLSLAKKDEVLKEVEERLYKFDKYVDIFYSTSGLLNSSLKASNDAIAAIQMEFTHWTKRPRAKDIINNMKKELYDIPGIIIDINDEKKGPSSGKPINISLISHNTDSLNNMHKLLLEYINKTGGFVNLDDGFNITKLAYRIFIDKERAMYNNADVLTVGTTIQALTNNGILLSKYRPQNSSEELDIIAKFPPEYQTSEYLDSMPITTRKGITYSSDYTSKKIDKYTHLINRLDGYRVINISSDIAEGLLSNEQLMKIKNQIIKNNEWDNNVAIKFRGESRDMEETSKFLKKAFIIAIMLIIIILTLEFNSFYYTFVTMTSIVLSSTGVIIALLITGQPFGVVMCGVGVIALAGIVVNNNILLIDSYKAYLNSGNDFLISIKKAAISRFRPILLTSGTTVLGLIPMATKINIDLIEREIIYNAPSSQWWQQLSTAIAGGLTFSTILTLFFTPSLLIIGHKIQETSPKIREKIKSLFTSKS